MLQDDETGPLHQWSHVLFSLAFESGSRMNLHASPLRAGFVVVVVVLCWSLVFLDIFPTGFQSHLSCARSKGWGVWCGDWVPGSQGKIEYAFGILLIVDQHGWNGFSLFPGENISGFFFVCFHISMLSLHPLLWRLFIQVSGPLGGNYSICRCVTSVGGMSSGSFCAVTLNPP